MEIKDHLQDNYIFNGINKLKNIVEIDDIFAKQIFEKYKQIHEKYYEIYVYYDGIDADMYGNIMTIREYIELCENYFPKEYNFCRLNYGYIFLPLLVLMNGSKIIWAKND
jgi:hypothetical protein